MSTGDLRISHFFCSRFLVVPHDVDGLHRADSADQERAVTHRVRPDQKTLRLEAAVVLPRGLPYRNRTLQAAGQILYPKAVAQLAPDIRHGGALSKAVDPLEMPPRHQGGEVIVQPAQCVLSRDDGLHHVITDVVRSLRLVAANACPRS